MSIDPGSRERHDTNHDEVVATPDGAALDAPRSTPLGEVADDLLEAGAPVDASQIDPETLEAPFEPITSPLTQGETTQPQETTAQESRRPWGKIALVGSAVTALVAGVALQLGSRSSDADPEDPAPRPPATVSGPVTPGPTSSPEVTQAEQLSPLEKQARMFERAQIPATAITAAELKGYIDPNALDLFVGVDGGVGLYPEVQADLTEHKKLFYLLGVEDIVASLDRLEKVMTGTHLDVVNGKVVPVDNATLMDEGVFRTPVSKDLFTRNSEGLTNIGAGVAGTLADVARDSVTIRTAAEMMKAEQRVAEYYEAHPDEKTQVSDTNSAGVIESTFANRGTVDAGVVDSRLGLALRVSSGEVTAIDFPNYEDCRVVGVDERVIKNANGSETVRIIGVSLVGADQGGELFSAYVTLVPATTTMGPSPDGPTFELAKPQEGTFNAVLIGKSSPN